MSKTKYEKNILKALYYMPEIFNFHDLQNKLQDNSKCFKISNPTIYKYMRKYCLLIKNGQWEKDEGINYGQKK